MAHHFTTLIAVLAAMFLGCTGSLLQPDDDDDAGGDDDTGDDDAGDDDAGDDDAGDDDGGDDDASDDDSGDDCPLVCTFYGGWTGIEINTPDGQPISMECPTYADVSGCEISGAIECPTPNGTPWDLIGEAYPGGGADGEIQVGGPMGPSTWPWAGTTTGKELEGSFSGSLQNGAVEGLFWLVCEDEDSGDDDPGSGE